MECVRYTSKDFDNTRFLYEEKKEHLWVVINQSVVAVLSLFVLGVYFMVLCQKEQINYEDSFIVFAVIALIKVINIVLKKSEDMTRVELRSHSFSLAKIAMWCDFLIYVWAMAAGGVISTYKCIYVLIAILSVFSLLLIKLGFYAFLLLRFSDDLASYCGILTNISESKSESTTYFKEGLLLGNLKGLVLSLSWMMIGLGWLIMGINFSSVDYFDGKVILSEKEKLSVSSVQINTQDKIIMAIEVNDLNRINYSINNLNKKYQYKAVFIDKDKNTISESTFSFSNPYLKVVGNNKS